MVFPDSMGLVPDGLDDVAGKPRSMAPALILDIIGTGGKTGIRGSEGI